jgi:hypothetical protein
MIGITFSIILTFHGLIHFIGYVKSVNPNSIRQVSLNVSKTIGIIWLIAGVLITSASCVYWLNIEWWWMVAIPSLVLSQVLIFKSWEDSKFGTVLNVIILVASLLAYGAWDFNSMVMNELNTFESISASQGGIFTKEMMRGLPPVVQKWLKRSNMIDKKNIHNAHLTQTGQLRTTTDGSWMPFRAEQWIKSEPPEFIWLADVRVVPGIHLAGRDKYFDGKGHMLIKLLSLIPMTDSYGKDIDQGAMLRYLGEIVWLPSAALNKNIQWEQLDSVTAQATMCYGGITASGIYKFNTEGDFMSFQAKRYYSRGNNSTLEEWFIKTEPNGYKEFEGIRVPVRLEVTWKLKEGDFTWLRLVIREIDFNKNDG